MMRTEYGKRNAEASRHLIESPKTYAEPRALTRLLSDSITDTLTDLLGTRVREAIYDFLERKHSISRDEIPQNTDVLFRLFEQNFGPASTKVFGKMIVKKMYSKLDWEFQPNLNLEFNDYLERIKTKLANQALDHYPFEEFN